MPSLKHGGARLADFDQRVAHAQDVAYVYVVFQHPLDGEVLSELTEGELIPAEHASPVVVVLDRVCVSCPVDAHVVLEVRLSIPVEVRGPQHDPALDRLFEDARRHRFTPVRDFLGQRNVYGE